MSEGSFTGETAKSIPWVVLLLAQYFVALEVGVSGNVFSRAVALTIKGCATGTQDGSDDFTRQKRGRVDSHHEPDPGRASGLCAGSGQLLTRPLTTALVFSSAHTTAADSCPLVDFCSAPYASAAPGISMCSRVRRRCNFFNASLVRFAHRYVWVLRGRLSPGTNIIKSSLPQIRSD